MTLNRKRLKVIAGGLPTSRHLTDEELLASWREVQSRDQSLREAAMERAQALRDAARAFDEVMEQLNELAHTLRHYRRELGRRDTSS